jgi:hypothetical protein
MTPFGVRKQPKEVLARMFAGQIIPNFLYEHRLDE